MTARGVGQPVARGVASAVSAVGASGGSEATPLLLDTYTGAAGAYSLRKLRSDYTGACLRVRRSSDSAEQDIGFTSSGGVEVLDESALTTFCGAGDGYVATWYDHGTNANHVSQPTASKQPQIVASGVVVKQNGYAAVDFSNAAITSLYKAVTVPNTGNSFVCTAMIVAQHTNPTSSTAKSLAGILPQVSVIDARNFLLAFENSNVAVRYQGGNTIFGTGDAQSRSIFSAARDGTGAACSGRINGAALTVSSSSPTMNVQSSSGIVIGAAGTPTAFDNVNDAPDARIQEFVIYFADRASDMAGMQVNANTYWSVY